LGLDALVLRGVWQMRPGRNTLKPLEKMCGLATARAVALFIELSAVKATKRVA
jgi:hypothetical protein